MKILWTVFVTFPEVADKIGKKPEYACTWARALSESLRTQPEIELAIASIYDGKCLQKHVVNNVSFYFLPNGKAIKKNGGGIAARKYWNEIIKDYTPDIIHIHGSESNVPLELVRSNPNIPIFLTLQGIISNYYKDEYAGLGIGDLIYNISLRDIVRCSGIILDRHKTKIRSRYEQEILGKVRYFGGRTTWDKVSSLVWNQTAKYLYSPEMIREQFYKADRWNIENIKRHRIFMHQGFKPIKGLHILLDAMYHLKKKYPDVELYMSGTNYMKNCTFKDKLLQPGYVKLLFKKIREYDLEHNIHFTGVLDADQIIEFLKSSHVMVLPSSIENSPNSLVEAKLVGVPIVASYVGGVPDMLTHNEDGFLYTFNEPLLLAEFIGRVFDNDSLAEKFSINSYNNIRSIYSPHKVLLDTIQNYKNIIADWNK